MNLTLVEQITKKQLKSDIPVFKAGDTLKVYVKIKEGNKYRIQLFEGVCIARQGKGIAETFTVRKISYQVGVERTFPVHSPIIGRKIRTPTPAERFKSNGLNFLISFQALPASKKPNT